MKIVVSTLKKVLFWSYDRGTWQYDVLCVLILAFIFLTPNGPFRSSKAPAHISASSAAAQAGDRPPAANQRQESKDSKQQNQQASGRLAHTASNVVKPIHSRRQ